MAKSTAVRARTGSKRSSVRKGRSQSTTRLILIAGAAVVVIGLVLWLSGSLGTSPVAEPGQVVAIQSREHIAVGASHPAYNSDPPAGGWHYANPANPGFYEQPLPDEEVVHNLEHGYIVISYDCSKLSNCDTVKTQLRDTFNKYNGWKMVIVPRQNRDANDAVALTAWGRVEQLPAYDQSKIDAFVAAYRDKGPEQTPN